MIGSSLQSIMPIQKNNDSKNQHKKSVDENESQLEHFSDDVYKIHMFHEEPEQVKRDINTLRNLVLEDEALYVPTDDKFLLRFLRCMLFDCEGAFRVLQQYYKLEIDYPKMYEKARPSEVLHAFNNNMFTLLPHRDQRGRNIFVYRTGIWDPESCSAADAFRGIQLCLEMATRDEETQKNGVVFITDWKGFGLRQVKSFRYSNVKASIKLLQESFPVRFVAFHIINEHHFFELALVVMKPILCEDFKNRMYFHGNNWESLHRYISPEILPEEYGGTQPPLNNSAFVTNLLSHDDEFSEYAKYGYNKSDKSSATT